VDFRALILSLKLALLVSSALLVLGMPLAYWLAFTRQRWKFLVEATVALPLVLPPTVLGFYLLVAMGPQSPVGRWWQNWTGHTLAFTFEGLVIGSILYSLPFAVQPFAASFAAIDRRLLAASASLGASPLRTFFRVTMPLAMPGIITGFVLAFAHTLGEFGVVLMIGGNIPGATKTISIAIYDDVQGLNYAAANQAAILLLVLSFVTLCLVYGLNRRSSQLGPVGDNR
jgi:molybdate transport system permease protein